MCAVAVYRVKELDGWINRLRLCDYLLVLSNNVYLGHCMGAA